MANNFNVNPMVIDTVTANPQLTTNNFIIIAVEWVNPASVNDTAKLEDRSGNVIFEATCTTAKQNMYKSFSVPFSVFGIHCPTLSSGKLLVYLKAKL